MPPKETSDYYVCIEHAVDARRELLEAMRSIIKSLQSYHHLKSIRKEKADAMVQLRRKVREIISEFSRINVELPRVKSERPPHPRPAHEPKAAPQHKAAPKVPAADSEISKLAAELRSIEDQLKRLG